MSFVRKTEIRNRVHIWIGPEFRQLQAHWSEVRPLPSFVPLVSLYGILIFALKAARLS